MAEYEKVHEAWEDLPSTATPINAAALDHLETGIANAQAAADAATDSSIANAHIADAVGAHAATAISFSPTGTISGTDVQTAVAEVATEAASDLSTHAADTTSVHGITDTSALVLKAETFSTADDIVAEGEIEGDDFSRFELYADGRLKLGRGDEAHDTNAWVTIRVARDEDGVNIRGAGPDVYGGNIRNLLMIRDYLSAPITWVSTAGAGLVTTDNIKFKDGSLNDLIRLTFTGSSGAPNDRTNPAIVFGQEQVGGGDTRTVADRVYKEAAGQLRTTMDVRSEGSVVADVDGTVVALGAVGPASQGGIRMGGDNKGRMYRSGTGQLVMSGGLTVEGKIVGAHRHAQRPSDAVMETFPRHSAAFANAASLSTGRLSLVAISLAVDDVVTSITFASATTALSAGSNQWFALYDSSRNLLGVTADDTSTAWASNSTKTLTLSSPYTVTTSGLHYVGICVVASTVPTLAAISHGGPGATIMGLAPIISGFSSTGLTNPASAPATAAAITAQGNIPYAYVS